MTESAGSANAELGDVTITRVFDAPREMVFRAFLDPEQLTHFWGPEGISTPVSNIKIDPRPGGVFETIMVSDADGTEYPTKGVFVELVEPERIVWSDAELGEKQTLTFTDLGGKTELVIEQVNLSAEFRTPEALAGFNSYLDRLAEHLMRMQKEDGHES